MEDIHSIDIPWPGWHAVRRLGRGGFGSVWEIERDVAGVPERCAMKVLGVPPEGEAFDGSLSMGYDEESLASAYRERAVALLHEYQIMAELSHPNVVSCKDVSLERRQDGPGYDVFIRMELLTPLVKWIGERKLTWREIATIGRDVAEALAACESRGIVHRDVKPANIMADGWGTFKLGDFGIARAMEGTMTATMAGTATYMAPEVARHEPYNRTVDIYSLGLVMYWALNGYRLPFMPAGRLSPQDISHAERLRLSGADIPMPQGCLPELGRIVLRSCAYKSSDRYQSAHELLDDLERLLAGSVAPQDNRGPAGDAHVQDPPRGISPFVFAPSSGLIFKGNEWSHEIGADKRLWSGFWVDDTFAKIDIVHNEDLVADFVASPVSGVVTAIDIASDPRAFTVENDLVWARVLAYVYQDETTIAAELRVREGSHVKAGDHLIDIPSAKTELGSVWVDAGFGEDDATHSLMPVISEDAQVRVGQPVLRIVERRDGDPCKKAASPDREAPATKQADGPAGRTPAPDDANWEDMSVTVGAGFGKADAGPRAGKDEDAHSAPTRKEAPDKDTDCRRDHAPYVADGIDCSTRIFIKSADLGRKIMFEAPSGKLVRIRVPEAARDGMTIRIEGLGLHDMEDPQIVGDLYVTFALAGHEKQKQSGQPAAQTEKTAKRPDGAPPNPLQAEDERPAKRQRFHRRKKG